MRNTFERRWGHSRIAIRNGKAIRKAQKRAEAIERQQRYDSLTLMQKIARLDIDPGNHAKQTRRLEAQLEKENAKK